jgi:hypothetical protein
MGIRRLGIFLLLFSGLITSCTNDSEKILIPKNDTTEVLNLALRTAFYHESLPGIELLTRSNRFKDSILFTSDSLPLSILPINVDALKFKTLERIQICSIIRSDSGKQELPNFLFVGAFEKRNAEYYVSIQSLSCFAFGGGGVIGIIIVKEKDSFIVKDKMSSSIN